MGTADSLTALVPSRPWTSATLPRAARVPATTSPWTARPRAGGLHDVVHLATATGSWTLLWLVLAVLVPFVVLGWRPLVITSGSMQPTIRPGDVVLVEPNRVVAPGDVVTIDTGDGLLTHRVARVDGEVVRTRGDANANLDSTAWTPAQVVGTGRLLVPWVGTPVVVGGSAARTVLSDATFVAATGSSGNSLATASVAPPTNLTTTFQCGLLGLGSGVRVQWTASVTAGVTGYRIERSTGGSFAVRGTVGAGTSVFDDAASLNTTYTYRVVALTASSWTATSTTSQVTTPLLCL